MHPRQRLGYQVEERGDGTVVYRLTGDLFGSAEGYAFQNAVRDGIAAGRREVVLDLAGVGRIDSSGIGILVALMWSASNGGGAMVLAAVPAAIESLLGLAMLLPHIAHAPSVEEALARLAALRR